jgi:hypothetical protein
VQQCKFSATRAVSKVVAAVPAYHDIAKAAVLSIVDDHLHKISLVLVPPVLYVRDLVSVQVS